MPSRILVFSDIHGQATRAETALNKARFNPDCDQLIYLGDCIDRGPDSRKAVKMMQRLHDQGAVILKGNHEAMLWDFITKGPQMSPWYTKPNIGGLKTLDSYGIVPGQHSAELERDAAWLNDRPTSFLLDNYIFVHAGLRSGIPLDQQDDEDLLWISREWIYGPRPHGLPGIVVFGHSMTVSWVAKWFLGRGRNEELQAWYGQVHQPGGGLVFKEADRICVDTGAATGQHPVTVYDLTNNVQYWAL